MFCIVLFQQHPQHRIGIIPGAVFDLIITAREKFADNEFLFLGRESSQQGLTPPGRLHGNNREREFGDTLFRNCIPEHQIPVFQFTVVCQGLTLFTQQILDKLMLFFRKFTQEFQLFVPPYQFCRYRKFEFLPVFRCCIGIEFIQSFAQLQIVFVRLVPHVVVFLAECLFGNRYHKSILFFVKFSEPLLTFVPTFRLFIHILDIQAQYGFFHNTLVKERPLPFRIDRNSDRIGPSCLGTQHGYLDGIFQLIGSQAIIRLKHNLGNLAGILVFHQNGFQFILSFIGSREPLQIQHNPFKGICCQRIPVIECFRLAVYFLFIGGSGKIEHFGHIFTAVGRKLQTVFFLRILDHAFFLTGKQTQQKNRINIFSHSTCILMVNRYFPFP